MPATSVRFIVFLLAAAAPCFAQNVAWDAYIDLPPQHSFSSTQLIETSDGGVIVAGIEDSLDAPAYRSAIFVVKYTAAGDRRWTRRIEGAFGARFASGYERPDGTIIIGGNERIGNDTTPESRRCMLMALSANGDSLWRTHYESPLPGEKRFAHCISVFGRSDGQTLMICRANTHLFPYNLDAAGMVQATHVVAQTPHDVLRSFRNGPGRIDLVLAFRSDTLRVLRLNEEGDSTGMMKVALLDGLGMFINTFKIVGVAPSSTGGFMVGINVLPNVPSPVWDARVMRVDPEGKRNGPTSLKLQGASISSLTSHAPGTYYVFTGAQGTALQMRQDTTLSTRINFDLNWSLADATPPRGENYYVFGYQSPAGALLPHLARIGSPVSAVEAASWSPIDKLDLR